MNLRKMLWIIRKETRSLLRNKRILIGIIAPLLLMPLFFVGYEAFSQSAANASEARESTVYFENALPASLEEAILNDMRFTQVNDREDANITLHYHMASDQETFLVAYDFVRQAGQQAFQRLSDHLDAYQDIQIQEFLNAHAIDVISIDLEFQDQATLEDITSKSISSFLPLILILYTLISIMNFSIELTTAEKETETLETLFSVPITRTEIVIGKLLSCIFFTVVSTGVILTGIYVIVPFIIDMSSLNLVVSPKLFITVFNALVPLIFLGAGISIGVGMFASSYKEAGAYQTPLVFLFLIPAYIGATPGLNLNALTSVVPILNTTLLMRDAFLNNISLTSYVVVWAVNALYAVISLTFMFKVFGTEKILFGSGKDFSFKAKRSSILGRQHIEMEDAIMSLAVISVLFVYAGLILPSYLDFKATFYVSQYGVLFAIPLFILWYLKASFKDSLGLSLPKKASKLIVGVFFWGAALSASLVYQGLISPYVTDAPTLVALEEKLLSWSVFTRFFFVAFTPALCEEVLFRGFALRPLAKRLNPRSAVIITAIFFSIFHLDVIRLFPTFLLGLVFGYIAITTGSIFPAIGLHLINNSFAVFAPASFAPSMQMLIIFMAISFTAGLLLHRYNR